MFVSRHRVSMQVEKKLGTDEGVMSLYRKKSINKPHSLFKPQGSKLGGKNRGLKSGNYGISHWNACEYLQTIFFLTQYEDSHQ